MKLAYETKPLRDALSDLAEVSKLCEVVGRNPVWIYESLKIIAQRDSHITLAYKGTEAAGMVVWGPMDLYDDYIPPEVASAAHAVAGPRGVSMASHIYLKSELWGKNQHRSLIAANAAASIKAGFTHSLVWNCATERLADWFLALPGSITFAGMTDTYGFPAGLLDYTAILKETPA